MEYTSRNLSYIIVHSYVQWQHKKRGSPIVHGMIKMDGGKIDPRGEGEKHASRHQQTQTSSPCDILEYWREEP